MEEIMKVLITGATGFIGRYLVERLYREGLDVRCLVRKTSDLSCFKSLKIDIFYGDLLDISSLENAVENVDAVYHLAGEVYSLKKSDMYKSNVIGTNNLIKICVDKNIKKFIYLSSIAVYKPPPSPILLTENSPCEPITYYGRTKLEAESIIRKYHTSYKIPIVIVRAPIIYGPYQHKALTKFFLKAILKKKIYIIGKGDNLRSLCYIDNLIESLYLILRKRNLSQQVYLISDEVSYTFNIIIKTLSRIIKEKIEINYLPEKIGDYAWFLYKFMENIFDICFIKLYSLKTMTINLGCNISRAKQDLGYAPAVNLENGLMHTINWIKKSYAD